MQPSYCFIINGNHSTPVQINMLEPFHFPGCHHVLYDNTTCSKPPNYATCNKPVLYILFATFLSLFVFSLNGNSMILYKFYRVTNDDTVKLANRQYFKASLALANVLFIIFCIGQKLFNMTKFLLTPPVLSIEKVDFLVSDRSFREGFSISTLLKALASNMYNVSRSGSVFSILFLTIDRFILLTAPVYHRNRVDSRLSKRIIFIYWSVLIGFVVIANLGHRFKNLAI